MKNNFNQLICLILKKHEIYEDKSLRPTFSKYEKRAIS